MVISNNIKKIIVLIIIVSVFAGIIAYVYRSNVQTVQITKKAYSSIVIPAPFSNYQTPSDFVLQSEYAVTNKVDENFVLVSPNLAPLADIRSGIKKLNYTYEESNKDLGLYYFADKATESMNRVQLNFKTGKIDVRNTEGFDVGTVEPSSFYKNTAEYFGLGTFEVSGFSEIGSGEYKSYYYKVTYNNVPVRFEASDDIAAIITTKNAKVVEAFFYMIPKETLSKDVEIKPIEKITSSVVSSGYYTAKIIPENVSAISSQGSEKVFTSRATVIIKNDQSVYYFYFDSETTKTKLLPALFAKGDYRASDLSEGALELVLINQDKS